MGGRRTTFELLTLIDLNLGCCTMVAPAELTGSVFRHSDEIGALTCKGRLSGLYLPPPSPPPPKFQKLNEEGRFVQFVRVNFAGCNTYAPAKLTILRRHSWPVFHHIDEMEGAGGSYLNDSV